MKKNVIYATLLMIFFSVTAIINADTVFLKDGRNFTGTVTKENGKVIVTNGTDRQEFSESEVENIIQSSSLPANIPMPTIDINPTSAPAETSTPVTTSNPADTPAEIPASTGISAELCPAMSNAATAKYKLPDSIAFLAMRRVHSGLATQEETALLKIWQAAAHDNKRKIGQYWQTASDFSQKRIAREKFIKGADEQFRKIKKVDQESSDAATIEADNKKYLAAGITQLRAAANSTVDLTLRSFMLADLNMQSKNYSGAEAIFRECCAAEPLVVAFWQGHGRALMEIEGREIDGLKSLLTAAMLASNSEMALNELSDALKRVPGSKIKHQTFIDAQKFLESYTSIGKKSNQSKSRTTYLMPGKSIQLNDKEIPDPPYDHLRTVQAVATVVGSNTLAIDSQALTDALEVYIQIDDKTLALAEFHPGSSGSYSRTGTERKPIASVRVRDYCFVPPVIPKLGNSISATSQKSSPLTTVGQQVTISTACINDEMMGKKLRTINTKVSKVNDDGTIETVDGLLAGETTGPVITSDGTLIGFMTGLLDVTRDNGGTSRFVPLKEVASMVKSSSGIGSSDAALSGPKKSKDAVKNISGHTFLVLIIKGERFD